MHVVHDYYFLRVLPFNVVFVWELCLLADLTDGKLLELSLA